MAIPASRRPTQSDVALLAGVSMGSASRVMPETGAVRKCTPNAVEAAARQLGHVLNGIARALAMNKSMVVGVVLPTINNPVYATFVQVLQRRLGQNGYHLLVQAHEYSQDHEVQLVERLVRRGIDGLILVGTDHDPRIAAILEQSQVPHVVRRSASRRLHRVF